jgi:hypothetical protein
LAFLAFAGAANADSGTKTPPGQTGDFHDNGSLQSDLAHARHKGSCSLSGDGCAILTLNGVRGQTYTIQASTDMTTWTNIGTVTGNSRGLCQFIDVNAPKFSRRFYRMVK